MKERKVYTAEFKREAGRLSEQAGVSVVQVAQELGVSDYSLYKWRKQVRSGGEMAFPGNGKVALSAFQQENVRLKKELERVKLSSSFLPLPTREGLRKLELKQERDLLKKRSSSLLGKAGEVCLHQGAPRLLGSQPDG